MTTTTACFVNFVGANQDHRIIVVGRLAINKALGAACRSTAYHANRLKFVDGFGLGHQKGHRAKGFTTEVHVQASQDNTPTSIGLVLAHVSYCRMRLFILIILVFGALPVPASASEERKNDAEELSPIVTLSGVLMSSVRADGVPVTEKEVTISLLDNRKVMKHIANSPMEEWNKFTRFATTDQNGHFSFDLPRDDFLDEALDITVRSKFDSRKLIRLTDQQGRYVSPMIEANTGDIDLGELTFLDLP